tara:strand:- start:2287 stop:3693 length:1407 start_codon:yes stop_codon:yes gene_type:complete
MKTQIELKSYTVKQTGAAVLMMSIIILIAVTLIILFASKVGMIDIKMSGNDYRAKEAFAAAEAGLDMAKIYSKRVPGYEDDMQDCGDVTYTGAFPCNQLSATPPLNTWKGYGIGVSPFPAAVVSTYNEYTAPLNAGFMKNIANDKITYVGNGQSVDLTGNATVSQSAAISSVLNSGPVPPIITPFMDVGGNMTIVANPHGLANSASASDDDAEVYLSAWNETTPATGGSMQTCKPGYYQDNVGVQCVEPGVANALGQTPTWNQCACRSDSSANGESTLGATTNQMLSEGGELRSDIVIGTDDPDGLPFSDVYDYIFNIKRLAMKTSVATQIDNCDGLNASSTGIFWSLGDCEINGGSVGSRTAPVIVIVEGDIRFNGGPNIWGLIVGIDPTYIDPDADPANPCANPTDIQITGTAYMHGAMASDCDLDLGAGTYNAIYDEQVFKAFGENDEFQILSPIAASWIDGFNE